VEVRHAQTPGRPCSADHRGRSHRGRLRRGAEPDRAGRPARRGPITFLISLFDNDVNVYEVNNNGNWYDFGFMLGVATVFSGPAGSGHAARRRSRSQR
jgi:hypothetical protein